MSRSADTRRTAGVRPADHGGFRVDEPTPVLGRVARRAGRCLLPLVVILAALLAVAPPAAADPCAFGPNSRVNYEGDLCGQDDPSIAVGPEGNLYVAWGDWRETTGAVYFSRSLDAGVSFTTEVRVDPASLAGYGTPMLVRWPRLAVDGSGIVYVAWIMWEPGQTGRVWCARSLDQGLSFEDPVLVSDSMLNDRAWPAITGDPSGGVHLVWCDSRNGEAIFDLYTSHSADGLAFRANVKANRLAVGPSCTPPRPDIGVAPGDGTIHIAWRQTNANNARWIYACRSLDGGLSFRFPVEVSHTVWTYNG